MASIFAFLRGSSRRVLFLSDGPTLRHLVPDCVSGHLDDVRRCLTSRRAATRLPGVKARELALARQAGVATVDPTPWFCTRSVCPVIVGNILLYRDNAHMVPAWSRFLAPVLGAAISSLVPLR